MSATNARRRRAKASKSTSGGSAESPVRRRSPAARDDPAGTAAVTPPRIVILSLPRVQTYEPRGREVCISITDPNAALARVSPAFTDVLRVSFTDIIEPTGLDWHVLFTPEHAAKILDFIDRCSDVEAIVIHCVGGLSRSPAAPWRCASCTGGRSAPWKPTTRSGTSGFALSWCCAAATGSSGTTRSCAPSPRIPNGRRRSSQRRQGHVVYTRVIAGRRFSRESLT